jgi:osmoprotectant transport system substrate-binding protein
MRRQRVPTTPGPTPPARRWRPALAVVATAGLLVAAACGDDDEDGAGGGDGGGGGNGGGGPTTTEQASGAETIMIGAQDFGESQILAEIYEQALDGAGYEADTVEVGGFRDLLFQSIEAGDVNFAPDYVASQLEFLNDQAGEATNDLDETFPLLEDQLAEREMVAFEPAEALNVNAFVVTPETAEDANLETLSDLAEEGEDLTIGAPQDCEENAYCLPGLERVYGLDMSGNFTPLDQGLVPSALEEGEIDVGVMFSTDGALAEGDLVVLEDDQGMTAADNIVPVATEELVDSHNEGLADVVDEVTAQLTTRELVELNRLFDIEHEDAEDIAADWLTEQDIPRGD